VFVLCRCVDGFSRKIVWLQASMLSKRSLRDETLKNRCRIVSTGDVTRVRSNRSVFVSCFLRVSSYISYLSTFVDFSEERFVKEHDIVLGLAYVNMNFVQSRFAVGDRVRVYYPRRVKGCSVKWQSFFSIDGRVERRINDATYLVKAD